MTENEILKEILKLFKEFHMDMINLIDFSKISDKKLQRYIKRYKKEYGSINDDNPAIMELKKRQGRLK